MEINTRCLGDRTRLTRPTLSRVLTTGDWGENKYLAGGQFDRTKWISKLTLQSENSGPAGCFVCFPLTFSGLIICSQCFRSSYKEVHVRLGDKNDHSPVFDKEEYHVTVSEAALVNTPITKLKVSQK